METSYDYLARTQSAVECLFTGIDSYLQILKRARPPVLVGTFSSDAEHDAALQRWMEENAEGIEAGCAAQRAFMSEKYALTALCGSLLHISSMAIRLYSQNTQIPSELSSVVKAPLAMYCVGRRVRQVPLGLVIYAARNQYNHIEDNMLRDPSSTVFEWLATKHGYGLDVRDPAFDLNKQFAWNYAGNITALIGWREYKTYEHDMRSMLDI